MANTARGTEYGAPGWQLETMRRDCPDVEAPLVRLEMDPSPSTADAVSRRQEAAVDCRHEGTVMVLAKALQTSVILSPSTLRSSMFQPILERTTEIAAQVLPVDHTR